MNKTLFPLSLIAEPEIGTVDVAMVANSTQMLFSNRYFMSLPALVAEAPAFVTKARPLSVMETCRPNSGSITSRTSGFPLNTKSVPDRVYTDTWPRPETFSGAPTMIYAPSLEMSTECPYRSIE